MNSSTSIARLSAGVVAFALIAGCSSVSEATKQKVARSEVAVKSAQTTVGTSEAGAVDLQNAKNNLEQAHKFLQAKNQKQADRFASRAELDAELAVSKSQSKEARKAADELLASIQTLRSESARGSATTTP
jgi:hypothetical protein